MAGREGRRRCWHLIDCASAALENNKKKCFKKKIKKMSLKIRWTGGRERRRRWWQGGGKGEKEMETVATLPETTD